MHINRIASKLPVSGLEILECAHTNHEFSQVFSNLYERNSEKCAYRKIISKVHSFGYSRRQSSASNSDQLDASSEEPCSIYHWVRKHIFDPIAALKVYFVLRRMKFYLGVNFRI